MNQVMLVGRLTDEPTVEEKENKKITYIKLAIQRDFKNSNGIYETDLIDCVLWNGISERVTEWCIKGDVLGIRGRLQVIDNKLIVVADKASFLSGGKGDK